MLFASDLVEPFEKRVLPRALEAFQTVGGMDLAFGGGVHHDGEGLEVTELCGTRTRSVENLKVRIGTGVGGRALALRRPASVTSYLSARGIDHAYDHVVRPEGIETAAALPLVVEGRVRWVIYACSRTRIHLGERWFTRVLPLVQRLERDIAVDDEVRRQVQLLRVAERHQLTCSELIDIAGELGDLAEQIQDQSLRAKVEALRNRVAPNLAVSQSQSQSTAILTPRELDVLRAVGHGLTNREAGEMLALTPNTVKSYLKNAMQKLQVTNRVQAILRAQDQGLLG